MKPIERLLIWLVPAQILVFGSAFARSFLMVLSREAREDRSNFFTVGTLIFINSLVFYLANIVIGIWLFNQKHKSSTQAWLWLLFGISTGFWALGIYLLLQIPGMDHLSNFTSNQKRHGQDA